MKKFLSFGSLLSLFAACASAQTSPTVNISYAALSATPAPSTIVLTTLGLLATFIAYRKLRRLPAGRSLAAILMAIVAAFVAAKASAAFVTESMTGAGPLQFTLGNALTAQVTNNTGTSQQITSITLNPNPSSLTLVAPSSTPQCTVGLTLANGGVCYVEVIAE
jgi:hypothetical protein